jgi:hypothetical protein
MLKCFLEPAVFASSIRCRTIARSTLILPTRARIAAAVQPITRTKKPPRLDSIPGLLPVSSSDTGNAHFCFFPFARTSLGWMLG